MALLMLILTVTVLTGLGWAGAALYEHLDEEAAARQDPHHSL